MRNFLELGKWNVICDRCGFKYKNTDLKEEWTGLMVCDHCWEPKHPQLFIKVIKDEPGAPWTRPEAVDVFVSPGDPLVTENSIDNASDISSWLLTESGLPITTEN